MGTAGGSPVTGGVGVGVGEICRAVDVQVAAGNPLAQQRSDGGPTAVRGELPRADRLEKTHDVGHQGPKSLVRRGERETFRLEGARVRFGVGDSPASGARFLVDYAASELAGCERSAAGLAPYSPNGDVGWSASIRVAGMPGQSGAARNGRETPL